MNHEIVLDFVYFCHAFPCLSYKGVEARDNIINNNRNNLRLFGIYSGSGVWEKKELAFTLLGSAPGACELNWQKTD